jgi:hypothetical protein
MITNQHHYRANYRDDHAVEIESGDTLGAKSTEDDAALSTGETIRGRRASWPTGASSRFWVLA